MRIRNKSSIIVMNITIYRTKNLIHKFMSTHVNIHKNCSIAVIHLRLTWERINVTKKSTFILYGMPVFSLHYVCNFFGAPLFISIRINKEERTKERKALLITQLFAPAGCETNKLWNDFDYHFKCCTFLLFWISCLFQKLNSLKNMLKCFYVMAYMTPIRLL